ncbi:MAG: hypothetical protein ABIP69_01240 [Ferruginibacter sp.]
MEFTQNEPVNKNTVFNKIIEGLSSFMRISYVDDTRPWGGFLCIDENDTNVFINKFFPHLTQEELQISGKLSPKILIVAPEKRLSWQYHFRRAEIWKVINGKVKVVTSETDEEINNEILSEGMIIELKNGERHRLIGLEDWGVIAEIWRHTDIDNPSDESDIVRLQDDYGR